MSIARHTDTNKPSAGDLTRALNTIEKLRVMTTARGCTQHEADTAALKIGQAIQRYHLAVLPPDHGPRARSPRSRPQSVSFDEVEAIAETARALLCVIDYAEVWVPFSQICRESEVNEKGAFGTLVVTRWFAERRGLQRKGGYHDAW